MKQTQMIFPGKRKENCLIDITKLVCAVLVVTIHTKPFSTMGERGEVYEVIRQWFAVCAVPLFFSLIGVLIREGNLKNQAFHYFKLYWIWTIIYMPMIIYLQIMKDEKGIFHGIFVRLRSSILFGSYYHLWFLLAAGYAVLFLYLSKAWSSSWKRVGIAVAMAGFLSACCYQKIYGTGSGGTPGMVLAYIWKDICGYGRNVWMQGMFFVLLGMAVRRSKKRPGWVYYLGGIGSAAVYAVEYWISWLRKGIQLNLAVSMVSLLYCYISIVWFYDKVIFPDRICKHMRKLSTLIFLTHPLFMNVWKLVERLLYRKTSEYIFKTDKLLYFMAVLICSVVASEIMMALKRYKYFAFLEYLGA